MQSVRSSIDDSAARDKRDLRNEYEEKLNNEEATLEVRVLR